MGFICGACKVPESRFSELHAALHLSRGVGCSREAGGVLGPRIKEAGKTSSRYFHVPGFSKGGTERGFEKRRRPKGHVKLNVYKLKGGKIQRIELPNFTNLFKVNTLVECTVPLRRRKAARLTRSPVLGAGTGMGESRVRTHESRVARRQWTGGQERAWRRSAENTEESQVGDVHIEYKNNRHLNTNN